MSPALILTLIKLIIEAIKSHPVYAQDIPDDAIQALDRATRALQQRIIDFEASKDTL